MLLWQGATTGAGRQLAFVSPARRGVFEARIAYRANAADAGEKGAAVDAAGRGDPGYIADRANWLRDNGQSQAMRAYLGQPRALTSRPGSVEKWYEVLLTAARGAANDGQYDLAYRIAAQVDDAYAADVDISDRPYGEARRLYQPRLAGGHHRDREARPARPTRWACSRAIRRDRRPRRPSPRGSIGRAARPRRRATIAGAHAVVRARGGLSRPLLRPARHRAAGPRAQGTGRFRRTRGGARDAPGLLSPRDGARRANCSVRWATIRTRACSSPDRRRGEQRHRPCPRRRAEPRDRAARPGRDGGAQRAAERPVGTIPRRAILRCACPRSSRITGRSSMPAPGRRASSTAPR